MRIAYLCSADTLAGSPNRRSDAHEHDAMMAHLTAAFDAEGSAITPLRWDAPHQPWDGFDAALIGTCWDYQDRSAEFLASLPVIARALPLFNSPAQVGWNAHKGYLRELDSKGVRTIPTLWFDSVDQAETDQAFAHFTDADRLVFKRQIGANAGGQFLLARGEAAPRVATPMMVQPFQPAIAEEGEISFVFIDGALSHAFTKHPQPGDYRVQSDFGGRETVLTPTEPDRAAANAALAALDETPLYARVDMVRAEDGGLQLMELELIEPFLYPAFGPDMGEMLHNALKTKITA